MSNEPDKVPSADRCVPLTGVEAATQLARWSNDMHPGPARFAATGYAPSVLITGPDRVEVIDPIGQSTTTGDGTSIEIHIVRRVLQGRPSEPRAIQGLKEAMEAQGLKVFNDRPGREHWKQGRVFELGSNGRPRLGVQVVSAPAAHDFWHAASRGNFKRRMTLDEAARVLHDAIRKKELNIRRFVRAKTVLAIDVRHLGLLGSPGVVQTYNIRFGHGAFGFHSIWVVGPTLAHCARLDRG